MDTLSPVGSLTCSSPSEDEKQDPGEEANFSPLEDLSGSSDAEVKRRRKKQKQVKNPGDSLTWKERLCSENFTWKLVASNCACKRDCLKQFQLPSKFAEVFSYRKEWARLHKTDQDVVVLRLKA